MFRSAVKNGLRKLGYVISRYDYRRDPLAVRNIFLESHGINVVLDVGANAGQYAQQLRECGYRGKIISFEPLSKAFRQLAETAQNDPTWQVKQCALGDKEATAEINISENSWSSSLLEMLPAHAKAAPDSKYIGKEVVTIRTLDALFSSYCKSDSRVFLKIDTQGFTKKVLEGGQHSLETIRGLQVEMSLVPLYDGGVLMSVTSRGIEKLGTGPRWSMLDG